MNSTMILGKGMLLAVVLASGIFVLPVAAQTPANTSTPAAAAQSQATTPTPAAKSQATTLSATGQSTATKPPAAGRSAPAKPSATPTSYRFYPAHFSRRAELYYRLYWGVDSLRLKYAESGEIVRFSYRVLDADKAAPLNDKKAEPALIDPQASVKLVVPSLEKVGKLRQSSTPQAGKMYWMAFSNKGRLVKPGDHVNVVIGDFRANGLVVE